jgi:hypothetical protein
MPGPSPPRPTHATTSTRKQTGRRVVYRRETPITNMYLSMMDRMGLHMEQFADSTGHLNGLDLT